MAIRISSDIPCISLGDIFNSTTRRLSEVPTTAKSTKNSHIHITGESFTLKKKKMVCLTQQVFVEYLTFARHSASCWVYTVKEVDLSHFVCRRDLCKH